MTMAFSSRVGLLLLVCALSVLTHVDSTAAGGAVLEVCRKFSLDGAGETCHFTDLLKHDAGRHGCSLFSSFDLRTGSGPSLSTEACPHYIGKLNSIDVAGTVLELPVKVFEGDVVFDDGAKFSYLTEKIYKATVIAVFSNRETLFYDFQDCLYIKHSGRMDDVFPNITFHFEGGFGLTIYPRDYLLPDKSGWYSMRLKNGRSQHKDVRI